MYPPPTNHQNYGVPLYAVDWVPARRKSQPREDPDDDDDQKEAQPPTKTKTKTPTELAQFDPKKNHVVLAGGGGEGSSGVPNAILVAQFDSATASLSDHPVARLDLGSDLPYRMAVHPGGDGLICSFPNSCRWFEWEEESSEVPKLGLRQSAKVLNHLLGAGQQLALAFNREGSMLAAGGEDGKLRVFKWPSLEIIINEAKAHSEVKQLDFSPDGKFLISLGSGGPGKVWDVNASSVVAPLPAEKGEIFCACRFSLISDGNYILNIADKSGGVITWNTSTWNRITSKTIATSIISFGISADGKLLACGTAEGDLLIVNSTRMRMQKVVKKAHLGFVTALSFSHDPRVFASISMDSSVRVTTVEEEKTNGELSSWIIILVILIAIVAYILKNPEKSLSFNSS